jgi:hypothetical protein
MSLPAGLVDLQARRKTPWGPSRLGRRAITVCLPLLVGLAVGAPAAFAQQPTSSISAQVVEQGSQAPVFGARISIVGTSSETTSDSSGHFAFNALPPGLVVLQIRAVGYTPAVFQLNLAEGAVLNRAFELTPRVFGLAPLTVEAARRVRERRFEEFRRRMARGIGSFITRADIEKRNPSNLMDMMRTVRGVRAECHGSDCILRFSGQPNNCEPKYLVDGLPSDSWVVSSLSPSDVEGIELYRGASELPAEYGGMDAGCGLIMIWTKSGP